MLAKRAKFAAVYNRWHGRGSAAPCNDNRLPLRFAAAPPRKPRPVLFCRWRRAPSGALECSWHIEAAAAEEPELSRLLALCLARPAIAGHGRFVTLDHIARAAVTRRR
ncbi:MAG TPA: hypothetical protein VEK75_00845 [Xanthobacteraceae bacterium]|nr:hypothetical protein [Xanthobacteraceae bacterium]